MVIWDPHVQQLYWLRRARKPGLLWFVFSKHVGFIGLKFQLKIEFSSLEQFTKINEYETLIDTLF